MISTIFIYKGLNLFPVFSLLRIYIYTFYNLKNLDPSKLVNPSPWLPPKKKSMKLSKPTTTVLPPLSFPYPL